MMEMKYNKLNYSKLSKYILALFLAFFAINVLSAKDFDPADIEANQNGNGSYTRYLKEDGNITHPISTLNSEMSLIDYQKRLVKILEGGSSIKGYTEYKAIYDLVNKYTKSHMGVNQRSFLDTSDANLELENKDEISIIAKNAAFVYLMGVDMEGVEFEDTIRNEFKEVALQALLLIQNNRKYRKFNWASSRSVYQNSRKIIHLLQAYDYLKGVNPDGKRIKNSGYLLQALVRKFYKNVARNPFGNMVRNDNHSLMFAGALGLASVILHDHSYTAVGISWHPETWAHAALWRINRTLWNEQPGKKTESRDSLTYGFGEGHYYCGFSMVECVLPYMLALKNARNKGDLFNPNYSLTDEDEDKYCYKPTSWLSVVYEKEVVKENLWFDENYYRLFEWYGNMLRPDGYTAINDDAFVSQGFKGVLIFRKEELINFPSTASSRSTFADQNVDVLAVYLEDIFSNNQIKTVNKYVSFDNGESVIFNSLGIRDDDPDLSGELDRQLMFYFNAKTKDRMKEYHSGIFDYHGHDDLSNFILYAGNLGGVNSLIIPESFGRKGVYRKINRDSFHNIILIDGKGQ